jgi:uncharacterized membrane protein
MRKIWLFSLCLVVGDILAFYAAFILTYYVRFLSGIWNDITEISHFLPFINYATLLFIIIAIILNLYTAKRSLLDLKEISGISRD